MARSYNVVDADAHVLEPADLWLNYLEDKHKKDAPQMLHDASGAEMFRVEEGNIVQFGKTIPTGFAAVGGIGMREGVKPEGTSYFDGKPGGIRSAQAYSRHGRRRHRLLIPLPEPWALHGRHS